MTAPKAAHTPGPWTITATHREAIEAEVKAASDALKAFPKGTLGLTPDAIKQSHEWQAAYNRYKRAFIELRALNAERQRNAQRWPR